LNIVTKQLDGSGCHLVRRFKLTDFGANRKPMRDFLLVIDTNLPPILHRFRDVAFDRSKIAIFDYIWLPLFCLTRRRDSPETIDVKFSVDVSGWLWYQMP